MEITGAGSTPFPASDFDVWAETYDLDVQADMSFPFTGYARVLDTVVSLAAVRPGMRVLDLGTGTANLAVRFADLGCTLWCSDFSAQMLKKARLKLPNATLVQADLLAGWPVELDVPFERIVSGYVFHHFQLEAKADILLDLTRHLVPGGLIVIADIAFQDAASRDAVRLAEGDAWEDEFYWIADQALLVLADAGLKASFTQVSSCAGVFVIQDVSAKNYA